MLKFLTVFTKKFTKNNELELLKLELQQVKDELKECKTQLINQNEILQVTTKALREVYKVVQQLVAFQNQNYFE